MELPNDDPPRTPQAEAAAIRQLCLEDEGDDDSEDDAQLSLSHDGDRFPGTAYLRHDEPPTDDTDHNEPHYG